MPIDYDAIVDDDDAGFASPGGKGGEWNDLFERHPEGGGPFGGRDNAATKLLGFLRAKRVPFDAAVVFAEWWNEKYLDPPMPVGDIRDKIQRGWVRWLEGGLEDATPQSILDQAKSPLEFIGLDRLAELAAESGDAEWLVEDLVIAGGLHFITAPPGGGKTWAAVDLVRACVTGDRWLASRNVLKPISVLYINEEMGPSAFFRRLDGLRVPPDRLSILQRSNVRLDDPDHLAQVVKHIRDRRIRLVVVDTFVRVHGKDENSNTEMAMLFKCFREMMDAGSAVVCLHHHRKSGTGSPVAHEATRGAGEIAAQADIMAAIEKDSGAYVFRITKHRHLEEDSVGEIAFCVDSLDDGSYRIEPVERDTAKEASTLAIHGRKGGIGSSALSDRILAVLSDSEAISTNRVVELVKANRAKVLETLDQLYAAMSVERIEEGQKVLWKLGIF